MIIIYKEGRLTNLHNQVFQSDVPLSIAATSTSAIVAIAFMPLNQFIYMKATGIADQICFVVSGIVRSAFIVLSGTLCGLFLKPFLQKRKHFRVIRFLFVLGSLSGLIIVILGFVGNLRSSVPFYRVPGTVAAATILPCIIGTLFGLVSSTIAKLEKPSRVSVMLEVGIQNKTVALSVLSFLIPPSDLRDQSFSAPILYAFFAFFFSLVWITIAWKLGWTNHPADKGLLAILKDGCEFLRKDQKDEIYGHEVSEVAHAKDREHSGDGPPLQTPSHENTQISLV